MKKHVALVASVFQYYFTEGPANRNLHLVYLNIACLPAFTMTILATPSASLAILVAAIGLVSFRTFALSTGFSHTPSFLKQSNRGVQHRNQRTTTLSESRIPGIEPTPLCDLQTFLRLCNLVDSGGEAPLRAPLKLQAHCSQRHATAASAGGNPEAAPAPHRRVTASR